MTKLALVALAALAIAGCQKAESNNVAEAAANAAAPAPAAPAPETNAAAIQSGNFTTASGLRFETLTPGTGPSPRLGDPVMVAYEGRLTDGTLFDSSAEPVPMVVGQLIPGFDEGLMLMRKGGRYRLRIPPGLGYGPEGAGGGVIPPNATLDFIVTLADVGGQGAAQPLAPEGN